LVVQGCFVVRQLARVVLEFVVAAIATNVPLRVKLHDFVRRVAVVTAGLKNKAIHKDYQTCEKTIQK
jgi:hypothetical protein